MNYGKYTSRQEDIINGRVPLYRASEIEFRRLSAKAMFNYDADVVRLAEKELRRRNVRRTIRRDYTEREKDIVDGKVPIEDAAKTTLTSLYRKAQEFGNEEIGKKVEAVLTERHGWKITIEGYNPEQTAIITGSGETKKVHNAALRGLRKVALTLGDVDVIEWIDKIYLKRGIGLSEAEKRQLEFMESLLKQNFYGKMQNYQLVYLRRLMDVTGKHSSVIEAIDDEIENRSYHVRLQEYSERELEIISGEKPLDEASLYCLEALKTKLYLDDSTDRTKLIEEIDTEIKRRETEYRNYLDSVKNDYTDNQRKVVERKKPVYKESTAQLKVILKKAEIRGESEKVAFIKDEVEAREKKNNSDGHYNEIEQMVIRSIKRRESAELNIPVNAISPIEDYEYAKIAEECRATYDGFAGSLRNQVRALRDEEYNQSLVEESRPCPYTKRQRNILEGNIPIDAIREYEIKKLIDKARTFGDTEHVSRLEKFLEEKISANNAVINPNEIARGEIPYEAVSITQLNRLSNKAKQAGDIELYELIQTLIIEKKADFNVINRIQPRNPFYRRNANINPQSTKKHITQPKEWALDVLESRIHPTPYTMMELQDLRLFAQTLPEPAYGRVARFLINERKDRSIVYIAQSRDEALNLINDNTWYPVKRPEEWDKKKTARSL